jgi:hypothetical protein
VRIGLLAISGWLVAAVLTVGVSWSAISVVRSSVVGEQAVVSSLPVPTESSAPTAIPTSAQPTTAPTVGAAVTAAGTGGMVRARCRNGRPELVNSVPNQGFVANPDNSGAEVQFISSNHRTEVKIACTGLKATLTVEEHASGDGGGGGDNHGGGGGGSGRGGGDDN